MNSIQIRQHYWTFYESIGFERIGLFECLRKEFGDCSVLYLGSSAHVSPSFIFSNVTYVDKSEVSEDFFGDEAALVEFVKLKKIYPRRPNITYIHADYTKCGGVGQYDIVLALFAPGALDVAKHFVGEKSLLVFLPLPAEIKSAQRNGEYDVLGTVCMTDGKYRYVEGGYDRPTRKKDMIDNRFRDVYTYSVLQRKREQ